MRHLFLLLLAPLLLAACAEPPTSGTASVIMPLKVGNQWIGRVTDLKSGEVSYDTLAIVQEVTIDNERWYRTNTGELFTNRADGLWRRGDGVVSCGCSNISRYPAERGDTTRLPGALVLLPNEPEPVMEELASEVMETDTSITVPAGVYSCYHYSLQIYAPANATLVFPYERFYAPEIGPVLVLSENRRWELVEVTLK